jgi:hypothetical protein
MLGKLQFLLQFYYKMMRQSICALPIGYRVSYSYGYENRVLLVLGPIIDMN